MGKITWYKYDESNCRMGPTEVTSFTNCAKSSEPEEMTWETWDAMSSTQKYDYAMEHPDEFVGNNCLRCCGERFSHKFTTGCGRCKKSGKEEEIQVRLTKLCSDFPVTRVSRQCPGCADNKNPCNGAWSPWRWGIGWSDRVKEFRDECEAKNTKFLAKLKIALPVPADVRRRLVVSLS